MQSHPLENSPGSSQEAKGWRQAIKKLPGLRPLLDLSVRVEGWWFDLHHDVDTSLQLPQQQKRDWLEDKINFHYAPTRPKWARHALRNLPANVREEYTFIDFGSGKGRVLIMAAEVGFRRLYGIELRKELHDQACANFRRLRTVRGSSMASLHMNAAEYEFPQEPLVLFFFNPFGAEVMQNVLRNLETSLEHNFRDVWVILHGSVCAHLADHSPQLRLEVAHYAYRIYRSIPAEQKTN